MTLYEVTLYLKHSLALMIAKSDGRALKEHRETGARTLSRKKIIDHV